MYTQQINKSSSYVFRHSVMMEPKECLNMFLGGGFVPRLCIYPSECKVGFIHCRTVFWKYLPLSAEHVFTISCTWCQPAKSLSHAWNVFCLNSCNVCGFFVHILFQHPPPPQDSNTVILDRRSSRPTVSRKNAIAEEFAQNLYCRVYSMRRSPQLLKPAIVSVNF